LNSFILIFVATLYDNSDESFAKKLIRIICKKKTILTFSLLVN